MTNDVPSAAGHQFPSDDLRLNQAEAVDSLDDDSANGDDQDRLSKLPPEERDDPNTIGAGVMSAGGTAVDRGTGTLSGEAQGDDRGDDDPEALDLPIDDNAEPDVAFGSQPGGGTH